MTISTYFEYTRELFNLLSNVEVTEKSGNILSFDEGMKQTLSVLLSKKSDGKKVIVIGNGGSAAIASHLQNDLCKAVGIRSLILNETPLLSALSNDLNYSEAFEFLINLWAEPGDVLIAISSSGQSENIIRAADAALDKKCSVITLSGFKGENPLRNRGSINFYLPAEHYGLVELGHSILTHYMSDALM